MSFLFIVNYIGIIFSAWFKIPIRVQIFWAIGIFSIIAFCYDPYLQASTNVHGSGVDLCRHFDSLDYIRMNGSKNIYIEAPLSALYLFLVANIFDNNHYLPMISIWIFYGISFFSLFKFLNYFDLDDDIKRFSVSIFLCVTEFFAPMNNIRYPIATSIFLLILFYDVVKQYKFAKYLYLIPICMHPGIIFAVMVRYISIVRIKYVFFVAIILFFGIYNYFDTLLMGLAGLFYEFPALQMQIISVGVKFVNYSENVVYEVPLIHKIMSTYMLLFFLGIFLLVNNYKSYFSKNIWFRMSLIVIILAIMGCITNFMGGNFTARFLSIAPFFSTIMTADIMKHYKNKSDGSYFVVKMMIFIFAFIPLLVYLLKIYHGWIYVGL